MDAYTQMFLWVSKATLHNVIYVKIHELAICMGGY